MSDAIDITLTAAYRIGGNIVTIGERAKVAQCVADDLIKRRKATLTTYEPTEAESDSDGGE
jgi:hypothetical protein